jgi:hypothetical protein
MALRDWFNVTRTKRQVHVMCFCSNRLCSHTTGCAGGQDQKTAAKKPFYERNGPDRQKSSPGFNISGRI